MPRLSEIIQAEAASAAFATPGEPLDVKAARHNADLLLKAYNLTRPLRIALHDLLLACDRIEELEAKIGADR